MPAKDIVVELQEELMWGLEQQDPDIATKIKAAIQEIKNLRAAQPPKNNKWAMRLSAEECATLNDLLDCLVLGGAPSDPINSAKVVRELLDRAT